jgi:dipeptidyl-peptidase-4
LLLIHGIQDPVVLQQNTVDFVKHAVDKNVQVDYMIYPGHEHNVTGKDRAHLYQKVTDYFMLHLSNPAFMLFALKLYVKAYVKALH